METRQLIITGIGALVGAALGLVIGRLFFGSEIAGFVGIGIGAAIGVTLRSTLGRR